MSDEALILSFFGDDDHAPTPEERREAARRAKKKELERNKNFDAYRGGKRKAKREAKPVSERRRYERAADQSGLSATAWVIGVVCGVSFLAALWFVLFVVR